MIGKPSRVGPYDLIFSGDPALDLPTRRDGEDDAAWDVRRMAASKLLEVARESGDWTSLLRPDAQPTRFKMRQIPGASWRRLMSLVSESMSNDEIAALAFRCAIIGIEHGPPGFEIKIADHIDHAGAVSGLGRIADESIVNMCDAVTPAIVTELGSLVIAHRSRPSGN